MTTDFFEDNIKDLMFGLNDLQRQAFQNGYKAGYKAKEQELLREAEKDEAQLGQIKTYEN